MAAMLTRSVRVSEPALRLAERTLAEEGTTFSQFVRDAIDFIARTGRLPRLDAEVSQAPDERMLAFESWADDLVSRAPADPSYASAPASELLGDVLAQRYA